ncbi:MAG: peptidase M23 [Sphingomonas sp. 28-66-16]|nr:MAG: peptidase M23 [Sphingomonas sp. 28-66-16]
MRATAIAGLLFVAVALALAGTVRVRVAGPAARPSDSPPAQGAAPAGPVVSVHPAPPVPAVALAVPVAGVSRAAIADSWGDPRENGLREHHGTDIVAPAGMPVVAAAPGTVEKLHQSAAGGTTIYVRSPDRQWSYYYAHLGDYAPGLHEGQAVDTGDLIGYVGDSGNAGAGNYHLHFGLSHMADTDRWWEGTAVDPYPSLAGNTGPG